MSHDSSTASLHSPAAPPLVFLIALLMTLGASVKATAQDPPPRPPLPRPPMGHPILEDAVLRRPNVVAPLAGPPGTEVTISVSDLPARTPLWLGIGATRIGFEGLVMVLSNDKGEISHTVQVPSWAGVRSYVFLVFDVYFRQLAMTRPFHVTDFESKVLRQGRIASRGAACTTLLDEDGVGYSLVGELAGIERGDRVVLEGKLDPTPGCAQATTIDVTRVYQDRR